MSPHGACGGWDPTESQNPLGWKTSPRLSPTIPPAVPRPLTHIPQCHIHRAEKSLQGWGFHHCPFSGLNNPLQEGIFLYFQINLPLCNLSFFPVLSLVPSVKRPIPNLVSPSFRWRLRITKNLYKELHHPEPAKGPQTTPQIHPKCLSPKSCSSRGKDCAEDISHQPLAALLLPMSKHLNFSLCKKKKQNNKNSKIFSNLFQASILERVRAAPSCKSPPEEGSEPPGGPGPSQLTGLGSN